MPAKLQHIRILSDGRAGHANQCLGLALALQRRTGTAIETVALDPAHSCRRRVLEAWRTEEGQPVPQLVIAAGHRTHLPLLIAARKFRARSVVIMKPSLPARWFDLCLIPTHDLGARSWGSHIFPTRGALNKLPEEAPVKLARGLIMIGGPSAHHDWSPLPLLEAIAAVSGASPEMEWTLGDSRRTPAGFLDQVRALGLPLKTVSHETTTPDWLPRMLMDAQEAWITADSTSMICEAFTARARTGILPLPPLKSGESRVVRAVEAFQNDGLATPFSEWREHGWRQPLHEAPPLHEAARCADEILARFFT